jgi:hypothetical protein
MMLILISVVATPALYGLWRYLRGELDNEIQVRLREEAPFGLGACESPARAPRTAGPRELYVAAQPHST